MSASLLPQVDSQLKKVAHSAEAIGDMAVLLVGDFYIYQLVNYAHIENKWLPLSYPATPCVMPST